MNLRMGLAFLLYGCGTDLDKDKIKVQMRELMTEAQALEVA